MEITEKMLLDGFTDLTKGGDKISVIEGKEIRWNYRYYHDEGAAVCDMEDADLITLEYDRYGNIEVYSDNESHQAQEKIKSFEAQLWGDEI